MGLPDVYFVTGTIAMAGPLRFSRNMTILREGERLVLVNSVRLNEAGLAALRALGRVTDVVRLAGFHGMDDPFYKDRFGAKVWAIAGQRYTAGFDTKASSTYLDADATLEAGSPLPVSHAKLHVFASTPPEALLVLEAHGGTVVAGDCLQNWATTDAYFTWAGSVMMRLMGFIRAHNVGPGWLKQAKPPRQDLAAVLDLSFENVLPAHGTPVLGGAKAAFRPAIERAMTRLS